MQRYDNKFELSPEQQISLNEVLERLPKEDDESKSTLTPEQQASIEEVVQHISETLITTTKQPESKPSWTPVSEQSWTPGLFGKSNYENGGKTTSLESELKLNCCKLM